MNQGDICKTAKREGKLKENETLVAGDHSVVDQCVDVCYSDEENMDIPTHPKYDHKQLEAENKELKNDIEELKLKLKQLEDELETFKSENKSLRQENYRLKNPRFDITKYKEESDIAFYTGFPNWDTFMLCYNMIKDSASEIIYGQYKK